MPVQECTMCGDVFNYVVKMDICPECQMDMADQDLDDEDEDGYEES
jgi:hypothetical protein